MNINILYSHINTILFVGILYWSQYIATVYQIFFNSIYINLVTQESVAA